MVRKAWGLLGFVFLSASAINASAAEVGLVTVAQGQIKLQEEKSAAADLKPFVKLRSGDRITLANGATVTKDSGVWYWNTTGTQTPVSYTHLTLPTSDLV